MKGRTFKSLNCKLCGNEVKNVGADSVSVTCWECVNASLRINSNLCGNALDETEENGTTDEASTKS